MAGKRALTVLAAGVLAMAVLCGVASGAGPTDPQAPQQQPLKILRVGQALDAAGKVPQAVKVLVADTGIDLQHPDLQPRLFTLGQATKAPDAGTFGGNPPTIPAGANGWDMIGTLNPPNENPDADPDDPLGGSGHGTSVSGILGAAWDNGIGGAGVAPNARFIALRTCWDGDQCFQHIQPVAFDWAIDRGARVISLSWLGSAEPAITKVIRRHPKVLFVTIPSGNGGAFNADPTGPFPCRVNEPNVLCVSTAKPNGGLDCGAFGPKTVDVAVPTRNNVRTVNGGGFGSTGCATSWASPTAAGVATILFGIAPQASGAQVRRAIVSSARPAQAWKGKSVSGGIVDALGAVKAIKRIGGGGGGGGGCFGKAATKTGTAGPNVIRGTNGADVIASLGGPDRINGRGGRDLICAGGGNDAVHAGLGGDKVKGEGGDDVLVGEEGGDFLSGGAGRDRINGSAGGDTCSGGGGRDSQINCQQVSGFP